MIFMYIWATITWSSFNLSHDIGFLVSYETLEKCEKDRFYTQNSLIKLNPNWKFQKIESFCLNTNIK